jgi:hypothetical protein
MKSRLYWRSATRSLARGGQRTTLSIVCVAVGVLAVVALQLVSAMVTTGLTGDVRACRVGKQRSILIQIAFPIRVVPRAVFAKIRPAPN